MNEPTQTPQIVILCSDMLFLSKITGVAKHLDLSFCTVLSAKRASESIIEGTRQLLLVDLNQPDLNWQQLASIHDRYSHVVSIAFGPHVDTEGLEKAKAAGCTQVLPRSQFSAQLPQLLQTALSVETD